MTTSEAEPASQGGQPGQKNSDTAGQLWLVVGLAAALIAFGLYADYWITQPYQKLMAPVDIRVYRDGGMIALHRWPYYNPSRSSPLYDWPGFFNLKFTYTPFAAMVFSVLGVAKLWAWLKLSVMVSVACMVAAVWFTLGGLGYRKPDARKIGGTLIIASAMLYSEPVQRVLWLGQIELILMALVMWDLCQPDDRDWKGVGVGIAAGIKLVPLIFIPYLILTRKYRQAAVATGTFAATVALGFADLPKDSVQWWFGGLFAQGSRTGFVGWEGNQSLEGMITRFAGSVAGSKPAWLAAAAVTLAIGLACAVILDRAGHPVVAVLTCALVATLISPISWDHHWVWIVPGITALAVYGVRASGATRWSLLAAAGLATTVFSTWIGALWHKPPLDLSNFSLGLIWLPPNTPITWYYAIGDQPWYPEYHWHGLQLISGNAFVFGGLALFVLLVAITARIVIQRRRSGRPLFTAAPVLPAAESLGEPAALG